MTVGLEPEQIETEVEKRLREFARSARLPGFRPGKVPMKVLRQRYGGQMRREVFGELIGTSFSEAVAEEKLRPAGAPQVEPDMDEAARRYAYTAVFEVLPRFELGSLEGKTLKRPVAEVTDADLDTVFTRLCRQQRTWSVVERPAQLGDQLKVSFTGTLDGEPFEDGSAENAEIELGLGHMIPGFEEGLVGVQMGDERRLDLSFPDQYPAAHLRGKPVAFDIRVEEIAEPVLPELDADFAKGFGVADGDLERLRLDVRRNMERELKDRINTRVKQQAMDLLSEANQIDLPEVLVLQEIEALKQQVRRHTEGSGFELPDNLFRDRAGQRVALGLVIAEVIKSGGIQVDPQRVREVVEDLASTYENPQQAVDYFYADRERLAPVESLTLENQVVDWVLDQVTVKDEPTTFEELTAPPVVE